MMIETSKAMPLPPSLADMDLSAGARPVTQASKRRCREWRASHLRFRLFTRLVAREVGVGPREIATISEAAPFHDVGKIRVAPEILNKPGPLTAEEFDEMKHHTLYGGMMLETLAGLGFMSPEVLKVAKIIAVHHHERWDGSGYPYGLAGEDIPMPARIVNLVDVYDALRSARPYKPAFDHARCCEIVLEGDGRTRPEHFDPALLAVFERVHPLLEATYDMHAPADFARSGAYE